MERPEYTFDVILTNEDIEGAYGELSQCINDFNKLLK